MEQGPELAEDLIDFAATGITSRFQHSSAGTRYDTEAWQMTCTKNAKSHIDPAFRETVPDNWDTGLRKGLGSCATSMIGAPIVPLYIEAPLQIMSNVLAAQLGAVTHLADMTRSNGILLESHLCTTQARHRYVSMPDTCGLSLTLQSNLHSLSATVS